MAKKPASNSWDHRPLFMGGEEEGEGEWLTDDPSYCILSRPAKPSEITLESLSDMLDQDAENCNAHDFVNCHRGLAALLNMQVGRKKATKILRCIADMEGLHGMLGIAGSGDHKAAEKRLGVPLENSGEWSLPDLG